MIDAPRCKRCGILLDTDNKTYCSWCINERLGVKSWVDKYGIGLTHELDSNFTRYTKLPGRIVDLRGNRYGKWKVEYFGGVRKGRSLWICICDCGTARLVISYLLKSGRSRSCGCSHVKHGRSSEYIYRLWISVKARCYNEKNAKYDANVGMALRWLDFETFAADIGERPSEKHSLARPDPKGSFCPENAKWMVRDEMARAKTNSRTITINGRTLCVTDWAKIMGIPDQTIYSRLYRGWSPILAVIKPIAGKTRTSVKSEL